jgi:hypothetical protein
MQDAGNPRPSHRRTQLVLGFSSWRTEHARGEFTTTPLVIRPGSSARILKFFYFLPLPDGLNNDFSYPLSKLIIFSGECSSLIARREGGEGTGHHDQTALTESSSALELFL